MHIINIFNKNLLLLFFLKSFHCCILVLDSNTVAIQLGIIFSVIPMANPGVAVGAVDVRFAATYGNPYLRCSGTLCKHTFIIFRAEIFYRQKKGFDQCNNTGEYYSKSITACHCRNEKFCPSSEYLLKDIFLTASKEIYRLG